MSFSKVSFLAAVCVVLSVSSSKAFAEDCSQYKGDPQKEYYCNQNNQQKADNAVAAAGAAVQVGSAVGQAAGNSERGTSANPTMIDRASARMYRMGKDLQDSLYSLMGPSNSSQKIASDKGKLSDNNAHAAAASDTKESNLPL